MTRARLAAAVVAGGLVLGGCGQTPSDDTVRSAREAVTRDVVTNDEPSAPGSPMAPPRRTPRVATTSPSLPPGDPGLDAPSVPDPGAPGAEPEARSHARRTVPVAAMLTADTVGVALGGGWVRTAGGGDQCVRPEGMLAASVMSYGGSSAGLVTETVATYPDSGAADAAVKAMRQAVAGCGWDGVGDPRLGSASVSAEDGPRSMVAVSSEGLVVLLVGEGAAVERAGRWASLVDLALGSSCPAAADGCH
ncbi:MAG TPA: hypothetical protein VK204_07715 [Nocardioidaceae bacterium]|nr:hypothetical protein [Nocardioidaceae bacterium]